MTVYAETGSADGHMNDDMNDEETENQLKHFWFLCNTFST